MSDTTRDYWSAGSRDALCDRLTSYGVPQQTAQNLDARVQALDALEFAQCGMRDDWYLEVESYRARVSTSGGLLTVEFTATW